ncbi:hypothetical protein HMPREF9371_1541 [Neisseria shayeganii 871]|uniref:Uncharacterized protein n=1 Tax=Neisseria shayeganii 871 TaxID=1032488 RepID=G4CIV2_9NEIS|nr:hypothetical protein HMPREF9371_1541 [Neisseria shayeganii 871]
MRALQRSPLSGYLKTRGVPPGSRHTRVLPRKPPHPAARHAVNNRSHPRFSGSLKPLPNPAVVLFQA